MSKEHMRNGYVIQLYQYAQRYRYNNDGCLAFFNHCIDRRQSAGSEVYTLDSDFLTLGDFDLLQIIGVDSFRKYHDVSELAKDWLGKRQSVLLYDISNSEVPIVTYNEKERIWVNADQCPIDKKFFVLSMLSLTNEIIEKTNDVFKLICTLREKILSIVEQLNASGVCDLKCEVFGTFNTSELAIIWLGDQYVDILQVVDFIKWMKVADGKEEVCPVFLNSFSCIAIKEQTDLKNVRGSALIQIAVHDEMKDCEQLAEFAKDIIGDSEGHIFYSVGEYDLVIEVSAQHAASLIQRDGMLSVGKREKSGKFVGGIRPFLRNNTRLLYREEHVKDLKKELEREYKNGTFVILWESELKEFSLQFEWEELKCVKEESLEKSNFDYFQGIRRKLKEFVSPSAGAVDTLDLMYADYHSVISSAYSALWVSDLHRQFKAVLYAIEILMIKLDWSWDSFLDLTNAFKQQIYHLSQSSSMFFEIPNCHFRSTGQYDFLMHSYYGITKKLLETIYLMQGNDSQSELIPLITVNTVPQVKTQLYFEVGSDDNRVINLDIPNSIMFDPRRGILYLTHEIFHYSVPKDRSNRNYYMALFLLSLIFKKQFYSIFRQLLSTKVDGIIDEKVYKTVGQIVDDMEEPGIVSGKRFLVDIDIRIINLIAGSFWEEIQPYMGATGDVGKLSSNYQSAIYKFAEGNEHKEFFCDLFLKLCVLVSQNILKLDDSEVEDKHALKRIKDRIKYCQRNQDYVTQFINSNFSNRILDSELKRYTWIVKERWSAVREACSDIAMVSMNGLRMEEYMLFCVQAWTDANYDRAQVLEEMRKSDAQNEWIRYALVAEYFLVQGREGWDSYIDEEFTICSESVQNDFCKRYVWFYTSKDMEASHGKCDDKKIGQLENVYQKALMWLKFFSECRRFFQKYYAIYYDGILSEILADFDIDDRITQLQENGMDVVAKRIADIKKEFIEQVSSPYSDLFRIISDDMIKSSSVWKEKMAECNKKYKNARFKQDISVVHYFQRQKSFRELGELNRKQKGRKHVYNTKFIERVAELENGEKYEEDSRCWKFHGYSLTELLFYMRYCFDQLKQKAMENCYVGQKKNATIWFRGHTSERYKHVPTVMREFKNDIQSRYQTLRRYQQSNFEEFKFRADGAPEMPTGLRFTKSDYIAMMQHYSVNTNFLDWTENAFTSLYLALKYYYKKDFKTEDKEYRNVTLSLFHPEIYNCVRLKSLKRVQESKEKLKYLNEYQKKVLRQENLSAKLVPNISTRENEKNFDMFLLGESKADEAIVSMSEEERQAYVQIYKTDMRDLFMPIAVLTSRLNPRIRTQCGCFVAYNLYTPPKTITEDEKRKGESLFDYISLEEIQEKKKNDAIFMYQIVIDKECCKEVVAWLEALGVSRENVYPELSEKGYYFE